MKRKRVVFLMSDTGGGHRSAANAIQTALEQRYPGRYACQLVDVYRRYTPPPFRWMPELYPLWVRSGSWGPAYNLADAPYRAGAAMAVLKRLWAHGMRRLLDEHPADVLVCVHALFSRPVLHALAGRSGPQPPLVTVVTDLVSTHAFWYAPGTARCLVPTQAAYQRALRFGLEPHQLRLAGLPVHPSFGAIPQQAARRQLGWSPDQPVVLLSGGADGLGPVERIARTLDAHRVNARLVILTGRNRALHHRLEATPWHVPVTVYPFARNVPVLMAAADVLVTKAGPQTIGEACTAGLPMVLCEAVPGQEAGNVAFVVEGGAGIYAPQPDHAAATVANWLADPPAAQARRAARARALGRPEAVWHVAEEIHGQAHHPAQRERRVAPIPRWQPAPEDGWVI